MIDKPQIVQTFAQPAAIIRFTIPRAEIQQGERYVAGPESGPDSANWRTELNRPLAAQRT